MTKYPLLSAEVVDILARRLEERALSVWSNRRLTMQGVGERMTIVFDGLHSVVYEDGDVEAEEGSLKRALGELGLAYAKLYRDTRDAEPAQCEPECYDPVPIDSYIDRLGIVWTIRSDGSWTSGTGLNEGDWIPNWNEPTHFTKRIAEIKLSQERN